MPQPGSQGKKKCGLCVICNFLQHRLLRRNLRWGVWKGEGWWSSREHEIQRGGEGEILQNKKKIGIKSIMKVVKEKDRNGDRERKKVWTRMTHNADMPRKQTLSYLLVYACECMWVYDMQVNCKLRGGNVLEKHNRERERERERE